MAKERITSKTCLSCGACCVSNLGQDAFCNVTEEDAKVLDKAKGKKFVRLNVWHPSLFERLTHSLNGTKRPWGALVTKTRKQIAGPLKGQELTTCKMLDGDVFVKVKCRIYKDRPTVCHTAVKPGDKACLYLRERLKIA